MEILFWCVVVALVIVLAILWALKGEIQNAGHEIARERGNAEWWEKHAQSVLKDQINAARRAADERQRYERLVSTLREEYVVCSGCRGGDSMNPNDAGWHRLLADIQQELSAVGAKLVSVNGQPIDEITGPYLGTQGEEFKERTQPFYDPQEEILRAAWEENPRIGLAGTVEHQWKKGRQVTHVFLQDVR